MDHVGTCAVCTRGLLCWLRWAATLSVGDMMRLGCVRVYPHSLHPSCMGTAPPPNVHCGMCTEACISRREVWDPCDKVNTVTKHTQWL